MNLQTFLAQSTKLLRTAGIASARLDCLVLASYILKKDKTWLLANPQYILSPTEEHSLQVLLKKRAQRLPLAYLIGQKEFYGRTFVVTPDVLIPRPETETLIDIAKSLQPTSILDVGTGSGVIAITLALETSAKVVASDISQKALDIAQKNARNMGANVSFVQSDLLANITRQFDCIIANLPYVSRDWQRSPETNAEPELALFAHNQGLGLVYKLLGQAPKHLVAKGHLLLEADPRQHLAIKKAAHQQGFKYVTSNRFVLCFCPRQTLSINIACY